MVNCRIAECLTEAGEKLEETKDYSSSAKFKQITTNQGVLFMGIFTFFYVGLEVTMGGMASLSSRKAPLTLAALCRLDCHVHH